MDFELWLYFAIVFSKSVSLTMLTIGNILILWYSFSNSELELLILTVMMMTAQITRIFWGEE